MFLTFFLYKPQDLTIEEEGKWYGIREKLLLDIHSSNVSYADIEKLEAYYKSLVTNMLIAARSKPKMLKNAYDW